MKRTPIFLLAIAALGLALCGTTQAMPIVLNGSFETPGGTTSYGPIDNWTQVPYPSGLGGFNYLSGEHSTSGFSWNNGFVPGEGTTGKVGFIQVYPSVATLRLQQTVSGFDPDGIYQLSYYENCRAGLQSPLVQVLVGTNVIVAQHVDSPVAGGGNYTVPFRLVISVPFMVTGSSADLIFRVDQQQSSNDATATIDGVTIAQIGSIPEPATLSLLAFGALALLRRRRKA